MAGKRIIMSRQNVSAPGRDYFGETAYKFLKVNLLIKSLW